MKRKAATFRSRQAWLALLALGAASLLACDDKSDASESTEEATGSTGVTEPQPVECTPLMQPGTDVPSGFERCTPAKATNRVAPTECLPGEVLEPAEPDDPGCPVCDKFPLGGACVPTFDNFQRFCHYDCTTDEDCGPDGACVCASKRTWSFNQCVPAACRSADDCEGGCGFSRLCYPGASKLQCRPPDKPGCEGDAPCPFPTAASGPRCRFADSLDEWICGGDCDE